ncbi:hypothetical protein B0T25DRAFT_561055 [Lasiosphaeria hispida]|uniref:Uncharacterized protein n=1 Tax=Lasiosphaeria hispida TaxID=260671 RepID=A0AAJ0H5G9_9PEZI|nr:hypothetical protein B0T25DRAFT_561055 [Lasiosphaeria hispida]
MDTRSGWHREIVTISLFGMGRLSHTSRQLLLFGLLLALCMQGHTNCRQHLSCRAPVPLWRCALVGVCWVC